MVKVINVTGIAGAAKTAIDLGDYLEGKIGALVKAGTMVLTGPGSTTARLTYTGKTVVDGGLPIGAGSTCAAGTAGLDASRTAIQMGDALTTAQVLELVVLYQKEAGSLF